MLFWKPILALLVWGALLTAAQLKRGPRPFLLRLPFLLLVSLLLFSGWVLWPRNFRQLRQLEADLDHAITPGTTATQAEQILRARGLPTDSHDVIEREDSTYVSGGKLVYANALPGEHTVQTFGPQTAFRFPCSYGVQVHLVFAPDGKMRLRHIGDYWVCP